MTKAEKQALDRATQKMMKEGRRQVILVYGSALLALHRNHGYGTKRCNDVMNTIYECWDECSKVDKSAVWMLDEETGIQLSADGRDYSSLIYMKDEVPERPLTIEEAVYMRAEQTKWLGAQCTAILFLALHRKYKIGAGRLQRLLGEMNVIRQEYKDKDKAIRKAAHEETGVDLVESTKRKE